MKLLLICLTFFVASCATKYVVPGNRFITPESQGDAFRGQAELQGTRGNQLRIDTSNGTVDDGVTYETISRSGFLVSNSLFDQLDIFWSHLGGGNSMLGGKFQFLGGSRASAGAGHKMSVALAFGQNEHEDDDEDIKFQLGGREFLLLYGYRFTPMVMPYTSFSYATYDFSGEISGSSPVSGEKPEFKTKVLSLNGGVELSFNSFFTKLEGTYQKLKTTDTKDKNNFIIGYSFGLSW
jgi:hypothetical protein